MITFEKDWQSNLLSLLHLHLRYSSKVLSTKLVQIIVTAQEEHLHQPKPLSLDSL